MKQSFRILLLTTFTTLLFGGATVYGAAVPDKGLAITPLRQYVSLNAGSQITNSFTVSNFTGSTLNVSLFDKQFAVTDYTYDYRFNTPHPNFVSISQPQVSLKAGVSQKLSYTVAVPKNTPSGGQYYTLFASANLDKNGIESTVQTTTLVYVTVNGPLIRTSQYISSNIPRISFGKHIDYAVSVKNTGNIHYYGYFSGSLQGLFGRQGATGNSHLLLPGAIRTVTSSIPSPLLPGIYRASYGYETASGTTVTQHRFIAFIPPWSVAFLLVFVLVGVKLYQRHGRKDSEPKATEPKEI